MTIVFQADSVQIRNSKIGDEVTVTFNTGIYAWDQLKDLPKLNGAKLIITVEAEND